jgi:hypothetical protein
MVPGVSTINIALHTVAATGVVKAVGSIYRIKDNWGQPKDIFWSKVKQEASLVTMATLFASGVQALVTPFLKNNPYQLLLRALATVPVLFMAEWASRKFFSLKSFLNPLSHIHVSNLVVPAKLLPSLQLPKASTLNYYQNVAFGNRQFAYYA